MFLIKMLMSFLLLGTILPSISVDAQTLGCGGTYSNQSGTISSPNYPSNYSNNLNCSYNIQISPPNYVNITFISFETQLSLDWLKVSCSSDSLIPVRTFTGSALPSPLSIPPCSTVLLQFHTDDSVVYQGFRLTYNIYNGCGGTYSNNSGIISSPNYPSNYSNYLNCTYNIQSSPPDYVNITFISFATEFYFDWLQVSCTNDSTKPVQRFDGTDLPPFLSISSCYNVQLVFHTDDSVAAKGFSLRYDIGNGLQGGLTMKPMNLTVRSDSTQPIVLSCATRANQPDVYPWWSYVSNDSPYYICVKKSCTLEYVEILTTSNCSVSSRLRALTSSYFNTTKQYSSRTCNLTISRSYFPSATGKYTCTDSTLDFSNALLTFGVILQGCGGTYTDRSGIISSPNYPSNYNSNLNCTYYIQSSPPDSVNITFISFATEFYYDWLQVGCTSDSTKPVQRFSGTDLPPFLSISSCYNVQLVFHTDGSDVAKGFSLRYDIGNGLQGGLTMKPMDLNVRTESTQPIVLSCSSRANQPDAYPWWSYSFNNNPSYIEILTTSNCSVSSRLWLLTSSYFNTTKQYSSRTCNLTISRSNFPSAVGIYTCTDSTLDFSNALITFGGCGGTYTDRSGIISSQYYPSNYDNNLNCSYNIRSSPPDSVNITFLSFATEFYYDWLQVSCVNDSTKPVQRFSGTDLPPFLSISSCYNVQLVFHTDGLWTAQGFSLRYDIGNAMPGGLTMKPMNLNVRTDSTEPIVLSCSSRANQPDAYPWWSYVSNDNPSYIEILTTSNCSVSSRLRLLTSSYFNTTQQYSSRTCNLTLSRYSFLSSTGIYTCTDSTLDFSNALITFVVPTFEVVNLNSPTDVVRNDQISVICSVEVVQATLPIPQLVPSIYLYSSDNQYPVKVSNSTVSFNLSVSPEILPSYGCDINFTYSRNFPTGYATNVPQSISFVTPARQVLYWPEDKAILIQGDNSGKVAANGNLTCFVPANPQATYQWTNEEFFNLWRGPTVAVSHNGTYTCTATNSIRGKTYEAFKSINVTVIEDYQPLPSTEKNDPEDKLNSLALVVGVVLGIAVLLLLVATIVLLICRRRKKIPDTTDSYSEHIVDAAASTNEGLQLENFFEMK